MNLKDFITTYGDEELAINIINTEDDKPLMNIWKTDYCVIDPIKKEYIYKDYHHYDNCTIDMWTIENSGNVSIYINLK